MTVLSVPAGYMQPHHNRRMQVVTWEFFLLHRGRREKEREGWEIVSEREKENKE